MHCGIDIVPDLEQKCQIRTPSRSGTLPVLIIAHPGHARDFAWYRGQRPSSARVIKM